jgi:hypothetical protein
MIAGTVVGLVLAIIMFAKYNEDVKYISAGDEKDLARNYCASLQKQDYHRIYSYFRDGTDGLTIGNQLIDDENRFILLARAAEKNGIVNDCHYQSASAQKDSYTCELVNANEASGKKCHERYTMTVLLRRGSTTYTT